MKNSLGSPTLTCVVQRRLRVDILFYRPVFGLSDRGPSTNPLASLCCNPIKAVNSFHRVFLRIFLSFSRGSPHPRPPRSGSWRGTFPLPIQFVLATAGASSWLQSAFPSPMTFFPFSKTLLPPPSPSTTNPPRPPPPPSALGFI